MYNGKSYKGVQIDGNYIGNDGYKLLGAGRGIYVYNSKDVTIGGESLENQNVISAKNGGILFEKSSYCTVQNNLIGTDKTGQWSLLTSSHGILIKPYIDSITGGKTPSSDIDIFDNVISGNGGNGIQLEAAQKINILRNYIGVNWIWGDNTGSYAVGNRASGIALYDGSFDVSVGDINSDDNRNIISGNDQYGIGYKDSYPNTLYNNYLGVDASGTHSLPNWGGNIAYGSTADQLYNYQGGNLYGSTTN